MLEIKEITCKAACHKLKRPFPFDWDLNVYRGCEHGCKYCYALYSHQYLNTDNFFDTVFVKTNIVEQLEKQLRSPSWKKEVINLASVCDSYQSAEAKYKIMPEIWKLLIRYKNPAVISTKSDLILRDYDLIAELAKHAYVNIAATITTTDEDIRKKIEPNGVESNKRFAMLKEFKKTQVSTGVHVMPILPFITDTYENISSLYEGAKNVDANYLLPGVLYLRGSTKPAYLNFIKEIYPKFYEGYLKLYQKGSADKLYTDRLYKMVNQIKNKYNVSGDFSAPKQVKLAVKQQLSLFD